MKNNNYITDNETINEQIKSIRSTLFNSKNGICAEKIRTSGLNYGMVFGTDWVRIKEIATDFTPSYQLANILWNSTTRETKLIATLLCPVEEMNEERFSKWIKNLLNTECAEIVSMALFSKCNHLIDSIMHLLQSDIELERICAYHTLNRMTNKLTNEQIRDIIYNINLGDFQILSAARAIESIIFNALDKVDLETLRQFAACAAAFNERNSIVANIIEEIKYHEKTR